MEQLDHKEIRAIKDSKDGKEIRDSKDGREIKKWSGASNHYENFIQAMHSRKHTDLKADILEGHLSSALCHTGNISYRLGRESSPSEILERIQGDKNLAESFGRMREHLAANQVNLDETKASVGALLSMDPKTERFVGGSTAPIGAGAAPSSDDWTAKANQLLTRDYRKPYVVPEKV